MARLSKEFRERVVGMLQVGATQRDVAGRIGRILKNGKFTLAMF